MKNPPPPQAINIDRSLKTLHQFKVLLDIPRNALPFFSLLLVMVSLQSHYFRAPPPKNPTKASYLIKNGRFFLSGIFLIQRILPGTKREEEVISLPKRTTFSESFIATRLSMTRKGWRL